MKRSTNKAPVSLSTSYLIGSPRMGISMITLQSFGTSLPAGTRSRFMAAQRCGDSGHYSCRPGDGCRIIRPMRYDLGARRVQLRGAGHYIAPNATLIGDVILEDRASVWFNVVIRGDNDTITIGAGSNVQDGSVLHTDAGVRLT